MLAPENDLEKLVDFNAAGITALSIRQAAERKIPGRAVVINLGPADAYVDGEPVTRLPAAHSCTVIDAEISGQELLVIQVLDEPSLICGARSNWLDFYADRGAATGHPELLRSPRHAVANVTLSKQSLLGQPDLTDDIAVFDVLANLWFSPAGTACGIHNEHDFVEVHTQLVGIGRMQKFRSKQASTIYEDHLMCVGNTNPATFCAEQAGKFKYPWHQYFADTDCVWMAIEYHVR